MANTKVSSNVRNMIYNGKHPLLPPKSPFPSISPPYVDYIPSPAIGAKGIAKPRERNSHHQRTSSESLLMEEQPSWLDELLNEPETPVRRGHRRSSSDSFPYSDASNASIIDYVAQDECKFKNIPSVPSWGLPDFDHYRDAWHASFYAEPNARGKQKNRAWGSSLNSTTHLNGISSASDKVILQSSGSSCAPQEIDGVTSTVSGKQDPVESGPRDPKAATERKDSSPAKSSASETDSKRAKQQFAQRSRVRKLQYIAELERHVQALQAKGSEVSAELEFLNQQSLILSMENKALKQRLESLSQEQLIKCCYR
ncbi:uncharacterized protein At4g06598 isoform X2 [Cornus florida]|uniref:uncharacterized protein At4g06598 isoform X2 n=1 Tax=Cornus florida TaxID=4283 RepID=UPI00289F4B45|nr:uncharacterized protein At4g06598 isoform X2 [Cornus florida]